MKQLFTKLFTLIFAISLTTTAFSQSISAVAVSPTPTNCTNTTVAISATQLCINYIYGGVNSVVGTNTIDIYLDWTSPGPICLGALAFISENVNLGQIPNGTYTLNVITQLDGVPQNTSTQTLVVASCCVVQASAQGTTSVCLGDDVTLINTSTNATSSTWIQNGNNISTADTLTLSFTTAGTYPIQLSSTNGSCTDVETINIVVNNYPTVNLGPDTSACVGQPILLNAATSGATSYAWSTGTTGSSISVSNSGTYSVVVSINGCTGTDTVVVTSIPTPVFNLGANTTICQGTTLTLDATVSQANVTYNWSNGGGTMPTLTVNSSGTYAVTATNSVGCSYSDNIIVNVEALPMPNLGPDVTLCEGQTVVLNGSVAGETNYLWSTGATTAGLTVDTAGTYSVTVTTDNGCIGTDVVVVDYSIIDFDWNGTLDLAVTNPVVLDAGNVGSTYLWNTGETTQTISVDTAGTYTVTVTTAAGCTEGSSVVVVNTTSTKNQLQNQVKVFPNPAQDFLVIENNNFDLQTAIITNSVGQIVGQVSIQNNNKIAVNDLASGFYFIQFKNRNDEIVGTTRFIKQ
jgi:hypothetical protein